MRKRIISYFTDFFSEWKRKDLKEWIWRGGPHHLGWIAFVFLCAVISLLLTVRVSSIPKDFEVGQIAKRDIKADRNYEIVDKAATEKFKKEALDNLLPVFDFDEGVATEALNTVAKVFDHGRSQLQILVPPGKPFILTPEQEATLKKEIDEKLGVTLSDARWQSFLRSRFSERIQTAINTLTESVLKQPIMADKKALEEFKEKGIVLRLIRPAKETAKEDLEKTVKDFKKILTVEEAKANLSTVEWPVFLGRISKETWIPLAKTFIVPNMNYNRQETESRKEAAVGNIKNVVIKIQTGESIIRSGSRFEPWHATVLEGIREGRKTGMAPLGFLGTVLFVFLALGTTVYFSERFLKRFAPNPKDYFFMSIVLISMLLMARLSISIAGAFHDAFFYNVSYTALYYIIPVAAGSMLIRIFLSAETSLIFSIILSLLMGMTISSDVNYASYCLMSTIVGSGVISRADHRSAIMRAGLITGLVNALVVLGILFIQFLSVTQQFTMTSILTHMFFAFLGGCFSSILVLVAMPIIEAWFDYASDIRLLELANLNHPLLKELIVRAPGTYHHSHIIGVLAEAAAEAINANPLLARVAAYYHDIGKMRKPSYFVENVQENFKNPHEQLSPHMSSLVVQSHVKEGIALAKEYGLPQVIVDMIPQHHGTKKISFFYEKAKEAANPELETVEEKDFRYPGPKPQSREAGILMLADATEASVRALPEKSPTRIQQTVDKIINFSFNEAQLDECDLTLKDLKEIGKAFVRILLGLYHQRIDYPKGSTEEGGSVGTQNPSGGVAPKQTSTQKSDSAKENKSDSQAVVRRLRLPDR